MNLKEYANYEYDDLIPTIEFLWIQGTAIDDIKLYNQHKKNESFSDMLKIYEFFPFLLIMQNPKVVFHS